MQRKISLNRRFKADVFAVCLSVCVCFFFEIIIKSLIFKLIFFNSSFSFPVNFLFLQY